MVNPVMAVRGQFRMVDGVEIREGRGLWVWCPGCDTAHRPMVVGEDGSLPPGPCWEWDGNLETPTISPSILCHGSVFLHDDGTQCGNWHNDYQTEKHTQGPCHSFIRAGHWEFLGDCAHPLAGQTVPMVPLPDWLVRD